jgi:hypothetical protein
MEIDAIGRTGLSSDVAETAVPDPNRTPSFLASGLRVVNGAILTVPMIELQSAWPRSA